MIETLADQWKFKLICNVSQSVLRPADMLTALIINIDKQTILELILLAKDCVQI